MALVQKQFGDLITFTRSSAGGRFNERGIYEMVPANQPRFNYDPETLQPLGILTEESRTNLVTSSNEIGAAGWATNGTSTIDKGVVLSPDGLMNGARLSGATEFYIYRIITISGQPTLTISVYAKQVKPGDAIRLRIFEGGGSQPNEVQTSPNIVLTDKWTRYEFTATLRQPDRTSVQLILLGNITPMGSEAYFWGAQMEVGAFATSLITTQSSQVTRTADLLSANSTSPWLNEGQGTLYIWAAGRKPSQQGTFLLSLGSDSNNYLGVGYRNINAAYLRKNNGGPTLTDSTEPVRSKMALAWDGNNATLASDGAVRSKASTPGGLPSISSFLIGRGHFGGSVVNGCIRVIRYYPKLLTDIELEALTK